MYVMCNCKTLIPIVSADDKVLCPGCKKMVVVEDHSILLSPKMSAMYDLYERG